MFLLSACGDSKYEGMDDRVIPYVQRFEQDMKIDLSYSKMSINIAPLKGDLTGVCYLTETGDYKHITLDPIWLNGSDLSKEETVYHELGHCVYRMGHLDDKITEPQYGTQIPGSIMNSYTIGGTWYYKEYRQKYIEAFKKYRYISL